VKRLRYLDSGLTYSPIVLKRLVGLIDPSRYDEALGPDRFTLREMVAHVADLEPVLRGRMELAVAHPGADVPNFDQDAEAIAKQYSKWEIGPTLEKFAEERRLTVEYYNSLTEEQQRLTVKHPILGQISVYDLGVFCLGHDAYHIEQASEYLSGEREAQ
jgi:hypothetical protein